jgi:hypothetical protein
MKQAISELMRTGNGARHGVVAVQSLREEHRLPAPPTWSAVDVLLLQPLCLHPMTVPETALRGRLAWARHGLPPQLYSRRSYTNGRRAVGRRIRSPYV